MRLATVDRRCGPREVEEELLGTLENEDSGDWGHVYKLACGGRHYISVGIWGGLMKKFLIDCPRDWGMFNWYEHEALERAYEWFMKETNKNV